MRRAFDLSGRVAVITGGTGLLGERHAEAVAEMGAFPVLVDLDEKVAQARAAQIKDTFAVQALGVMADITDPEAVQRMLMETLKMFGRVDILINNAANNPKVEDETSDGDWTRLKNLPLEAWNRDLAVGLTGAFICSSIIGSEMVRRRRGVILNVASDLSMIGPDQRIYRRAGAAEEDQPVKPASYVVVKAGLLGLTRYLATYWADKGVRVNAISPGGVYAGQDPEFVRRLTALVPLGRMADVGEYKAAVVFMVSDASSYMTGANVVIDGGRTAW